MIDAPAQPSDPLRSNGHNTHKAFLFFLSVNIDVMTRNVDFLKKRPDHNM